MNVNLPFPMPLTGDLEVWNDLSEGSDFPSDFHQKDCLNVKSISLATGVLRHSQTMGLCGCKKLGLEYATVELLGKHPSSNPLFYSNSTRTWEGWSKKKNMLLPLALLPNHLLKAKSLCLRYVYPLAATNLYFPHRTRSLEGLCVLLVESSEASLDWEPLPTETRASWQGCG